MVNRSAIASRQQGRIDHGGIGAQGHVPVQPVVIDTGNPRALLRNRGFLLHDGSHGHDAMHIGVAEQSDLLRLLRKRRTIAAAIS